MKPRLMMERYAKDVMRDPLYAALDHRKNWINLTLLSWIAFFVAGFGASTLSGASAGDAVQFGASLLVGRRVRTVLVWHTTWAVNSVTHVWGYRNYETPDGSRNNLIVGSCWRAGRVGTTIITPPPPPPGTGTSGGNST